MNLIKFLYDLIPYMAFISDKDRGALEDEAQKWYRSLLNKPIEKQNFIEKYIVLYGDHWLFKTALCVIFPFGVNYFARLRSGLVDKREYNEIDE